MTNKENYQIVPAVEADIEAIVKLIESAPEALVPVSGNQVHEWISAGHSIVAKDSAGKIIGHQGVAIWPGSGWVEVRSAVVDASHRGMGINTKMKALMIIKLRDEHRGATIVGFTEAASGSRGILQRLGFTELALEKTPDEFFTICPAKCVRKTGVDCGCKVYVLPPNE